MKKVARIAVTGGAGQISYSLLFRLASGELLGKDQPIALHILEIEPAMKALNGVLLELVDCAFPLLQEVVIGSDPMKVFKDVEYAFLVGSQPRKPGMERRDLLEVNGKIFVEQGRSLDLVASKDLIALVVGNPCNTNCLIAAAHVKRLGHQNFFAMTTLDENRLKGQLAEKANVLPGDVKRAIVWGNHSATQVPDFFHATIKGKPATEVVVDNEWLKNVMVPRIQKRGAEVLEARGFSSAASAANAAIDSMKNLIFPTPKGEFFSMSVYSKDNPYGIDPDLYYSMPCISYGNGKVEVVAGLDIPSYLREKMILSEKELQEERAAVRGMCPFLN